jgi:hypothetical protein
MNFLLSIFIFLLVLFLYLHITYQYKRSEDLEIYELDYSQNKHLQEVCDVKQPVLFDFKPVDQPLFMTIQKDSWENNDITIKDSNDYFRETVGETAVDFIVLPYQSAYQLMKSDPQSHFFTENNNEFIEESENYDFIRDMDEFLKPAMIAQTKYDFCTGSKNAVTPLRYHTHYRHFYLVTHGKINIKMTPFKSSKYLHPIKDYENFEFRSPVNVWNPQEKYHHEMDKIKFLEFDVLEGFILYIPPYWWYSIKYTSEDTTMIGLTYNSIMNVVANLPDTVQCFFQQQTIKKKITNTVSFDGKENMENKEELGADAEEEEDEEEEKENIKLEKSI